MSGLVVKSFYNTYSYMYAYPISSLISDLISHLILKSPKISFKIELSTKY